MAARLQEKYNAEIKQAISKELGITNAMAIPKIEKIVINMGLGEATQNVKIMDPLVADLASIAGQKPIITKAKKSIAAFKLREGMPIGAMVTLRGDTMYESGLNSGTRESTHHGNHRKARQDARKPKFKSRQHNRCQICGRPRAFLRKFGVCRLCFRGLALKGEIPGVVKSSW